MTKIPLKPQKGPKYPLNLKNDQSTQKKITKTTQNLQNDQKYHRNPKNDQNTLET